MLTLIAFCFFCAMSVAQPDRMLFGNQTIAIPIGQTVVGFNAFMLVAPITLLGLTTYLHVFLGHARRMEQIPEADRIPALFNMDAGLGSIATYVIFYWLTPLMIAGFAWKAALRGIGPALYLGALVTALGLLWLQLRRGLGTERKGLRVALWLVFAVMVALAAECLLWFIDRDASFVTRSLRDARSWDLRGEDLSGLTLRSSNLRRAQLDGANLEGTDLTEVILRGADLSRTNLQGAVLSRADLTGAKVKDTRLDCAFLGEANLAGASFIRTDLTYTIGMSAALVDEPYRNLVPPLPMKMEEVPEHCLEYTPVKLLVEERLKALRNQFVMESLIHSGRSRLGPEMRVHE